MKVNNFPIETGGTSNDDALQKSYSLKDLTLSQAQSRIFELENSLKILECWEEDRSKLFQSLMRRDAELSKIRHALQDSTRACDDLTTKMKVRFEEIVYLTKRIVIAEDRVEELTRSTSWKITAPARKIMKVLRRVKG